jgi:putative ABC transport system permease protein
MFKNYMKIAWRNLARHKLFSFINIGGLAVGMAVSFMLLLYVYNEFTFDKHNEKGDRIYMLYRNQPADGEIQTSNSMPVQVAGAIKKDFPEIEKAARTNAVDDNLVNYNGKTLKISMLSADPELLDIFTYKFVKGNRQKAFADVASVVLTESGAKSIFGNEEAMDKTIKLNKNRMVKVTGIIKDLPENASIKFNMLGSWELLEAEREWVKTSGWGNYSFKTYALVKPGADIKKLNAKMSSLIARNDAFNKENKVFLYPFERIHLYDKFKNGVNIGGDIEYIRLFMFLAIGILLIACINFMNLSTARSQNRAREVGVRKVVGARRISLIKQFIGESLLMAIISFVFALVIVALLLPYFNSIINKSLTIPYNVLNFWIVGLGITIITGIIAGQHCSFRHLSRLRC